jgi:hypothetical protein
MKLNKFRRDEFSKPTRTRKIDVHNVRKENLELKEQLKKAQNMIEDDKHRPVDYSRAFTHAKPTTDNAAMRLEGYQPLPKADRTQRIMMGDGTNPFVRY